MRGCLWIFTSVAFRRWTYFVLPSSSLTSPVNTQFLVPWVVKYFCFTKARTFAWVSPPGPPPHLCIDRMVHGVEGGTAGTKPMVVRPSSYHGVELDDHLSSRAILVFLDNCSHLL